jgi:Ca-activated chloride channel family protein
MIFKDFWLLFFIPLLILGALWLRHGKNKSSLNFSSQDLFRPFNPSGRVVFSRNLIFLRALILALFLLALARPRLPLEISQVEAEGIDIVLAIDASGSMLAEDFKRGARRSNRI